MKAWWLLVPVLLILASTLPWGDRSEEPIDVAIIWHQHQPLYWNRLTQTYDLPWVRVHGVQEYIDSARILAEYPDVRITFNLQPSLLWQLADYCVTTPEELLRHDLYQHIGAIDNHLTWMWTLATDPVSLDPADRAALEEQVFWLNGYMFDEDDNDPYYDPVYARLRSTADDRALSDAELLDASALFLLWQISPELHAELGLSGYRSHQGFGLPDLVTLIEAQRDVLNRVVDAYADTTIRFCRFSASMDGPMMRSPRWVQA